MKAVDSHCHLDFEQFDSDRSQVIEDAREELDFVVNAGTGIENNTKTLELAEEYPEFVLPALGLHPTSLDDFDRIGEAKEQIRNNEPVAIGEIGLDYHHVTEESMRETQTKVFREMLELAEKEEKPVVIHSRNAEKDAVEQLEDFNLDGVMLHAFNGRPELAEKASEDAMIGVTTQVLYSSRVQEIVRRIGVENILLETDSPFMYPDGRNQPQNVLESAGKIAEILDLEQETVIRTTTRNARSLFNQQ